MRQWWLAVALYILPFELTDINITQPTSAANAHMKHETDFNWGA